MDLCDALIFLILILAVLLSFYHMQILVVLSSPLVDRVTMVAALEASNQALRHHGALLHP